MRARRTISPILAGLVAATAWTAIASAADGAIEIPRGANAPALLERLGDATRRTAVAVANEGGALAAAFPAGKEDRDSRVAVIGPGDDESISWIIDGAVTVLRFGPEASWLAALVEHSDRKGRRSASLAVFDLERPDRRPRVLTLPATARGLDVRREDGRIAVVSDDEVRTFEAGTLRSGRVYSVAGGNRSVAFVPGGAKILLGRSDGIWRIDLAARQERDGMPVDSRVGAGGPVVELAVSPRGDRALARLEGDGVLEVRVDPLEVESTGRTAATVAWPGREEPAPPPPPAPAPKAEPVPEPVPEPGPEPAAAPPAVPVALPDGQVAGSLTGAARSEVAAVRFLGPDNLLREASRVSPAPDGTWRVDGLPPGTYRVIAEGTGGAVLECTPPFRTVRIDEGERVEVEPIEVRAAVR